MNRLDNLTFHKIQGVIISKVASILNLGSTVRRDYTKIQIDVEGDVIETTIVREL